MMWMNNVNIFQVAKVQSQGVAYKSFAYEKSVYLKFQAH